MATTAAFRTRCGRGWRCWLCCFICWISQCVVHRWRGAGSEMIPRLLPAARRQSERNAIVAFDKPVVGTIGQADGQEHAEAADATLVDGGFDAGASAGGQGSVPRAGA